MISECKIYRPKKSGGLRLARTVSAKKCNKAYWANLDADNPVSTQMVMRVCGECFEEYQVKSKSQKYCMDKKPGAKFSCSYIVQLRRMREQRRKDNEKRKVGTLTKECQVCRKEFKTNRPAMRFCQKPCTKRLYEKKLSRKHAESQGRVWRPPIKCDMCRILFVPIRSDSRFCGQPCNI